MSKFQAKKNGPIARFDGIDCYQSRSKKPLKSPGKPEKKPGQAGLWGV